MHRIVLGGAIALLALEPSAFAKAPQPVKPAPAALFAGRWYQVARIVSGDPHPCHDATEDFLAIKGGGFAVTLACRNGGKVNQTTVKGEVVPGSAGAKFRVSFMGGLLHQEYWVLDHAADGAWALLATPGGHYLWLLARTPALAVAEKAAAMGAIRALGYDAARLRS